MDINNAFGSQKRILNMILIPIKVVAENIVFSIALADPEVIEFFESKRDLPRATSTSALSSASVLRLLGKMGDTVNKMSAVKMEETDPWYEEKV